VQALSLDGFTPGDQEIVMSLLRIVAADPEGHWVKVRQQSRVQNYAKAYAVHYDPD
jgi:hypothetical protein